MDQFNGLSTLYELRTDKNILASVRKSKNSVNPEKFKDKNFRKQLLSQRKKLLSMMGANNTVISDQKWTGEKVFFKGSYTDSDGNIVNFIEAHSYTKEGVLQILIAATGKSLNGKEKSTQELLQSYNMAVEW